MNSVYRLHVAILVWLTTSRRDERGGMSAQVIMEVGGIAISAIVLGAIYGAWTDKLQPFYSSVITCITGGSGCPTSL